MSSKSIVDLKMRIVHAIDLSPLTCYETSATGHHSSNRHSQCGCTSLYGAIGANSAWVDCAIDRWNSIECNHSSY